MYNKIGDIMLKVLNNVIYFVYLHSHSYGSNAAFVGQKAAHNHALYVDRTSYVSFGGTA